MNVVRRSMAANSGVELIALPESLIRLKDK
jgi:hypothetical protein